MFPGWNWPGLVEAITRDLGLRALEREGWEEDLADLFSQGQIDGGSAHSERFHSMITSSNDKLNLIKSLIDSSECNWVIPRESHPENGQNEIVFNR